MKNKLFITPLLLITTALIGCDDSITQSTKKTVTREVVVLVDNTDTVPDRTDMLAGFQTNVLDGGYGNVTFSYITDVELNKTETILFPIEITGAENEFDTMTITNAFKESFGTKFNEVSKKFLDPANGKGSSTVYRVVKTAIEKLNQSKAEKKTLVLISDMIENSDCANLYKFKSSVEDMAKQMASCGGDLVLKPVNLEVLILFQPKNPKQDKQFAVAMKVWKVIFDHYGIPYKVAANI